MEPPLHKENPTLPPDVIDEFSKIAVYKIYRNLLLILHTNNELLKREIKEISPSTTASKKNKKT